MFFDGCPRKDTLANLAKPIFVINDFKAIIVSVSKDDFFHPYHSTELI